MYLSFIGPVKLQIYTDPINSIQTKMSINIPTFGFLFLFCVAKLHEFTEKTIKMISIQRLFNILRYNFMNNLFD